MSQDIESFNEEDDEWLSELETRAIDLEKDLFDWRESRAREVTESVYRREAVPRSRVRPGEENLSREQVGGRTSAVRVAPRADGGHAQAGTRTGTRSGSGSGAHPLPPPAEERTRALIDHGRRSVDRARRSRGRKITIVTAAAVAIVTALVLVVFRNGASWPSSVATVQNEITAACQNPNIASEPGQVNFACGKTTSQILWIFALMTSNDNPNYTDSKTGREGLEPITATQGGEVAWSLDLHHPYNPYDPVDSIAVAARAINNIVGGATLTNAKGKPAVQPGLESSPANCQQYTGSSAVIARAGFPDVCAQPVTSTSGQAALAADVYQEWVVGATAAAAKNVSVLFENANNPGNPQVQAILQTLPGGR
jgi:hypothetical protein